MARKGFIYFLFNKDKKPLYVDGNGFVQVGTDDYFKPDGQPARLVYSPDGWKDTLVKYARNIKYWGVLRDYTVPMKFVGDGASILRKQVWEQNGTETTTYLGIAKLDRTGLPYNYYSWYMSEINFSKFVQSKTGFQVEALEGGLSKIFKANENTKYEIDIDDDPEHINIFMDGMEFDFSVNIGVIPEQAITGLGSFNLGSTEVSREGSTLDVLFTQIIMPVPESSYPNDNYQVRVSKSQELRITGSLEIEYTKFSGIIPQLSEARLMYGINDGTSGSVAYTNIFSEIKLGGETHTYEFDITLTLTPEQRQHLVLYGGPDSGGDPEIQYIVKSGEIKYQYVYRHAQSTIKALRPFRLLDRLIYKMTEGKYTAKSTRLENMLDIAVTSGDALRGIASSKIKTSLADFFKSFFSRFNICLTVHNDQLVMEPMSDFFQSSIICDLGQVDDVTVVPAEDLLNNTIKAGYEKQDYTDANGKYETNQGQQWTMPVNKTVRELDMMSPYRADPFGIELLRINYDKRTTTDTSSDNDTFLLNITTEETPVLATVDFVTGSPDFMLIPGSTPFHAGQRIRITTLPSAGPNDGDYTIAGVGAIFGAQVVFLGASLTPITGQNIRITFLSQGVYNLYRPPYSSVTGIPHPDYAFNLELTPKKGLLANASYLHSILDLLDTEKIKFQSSDKNAELSTTLAGVTVTEKEDIQIGNLAAPYFRPYYINMRTKVPVNLVELLKVNPWGKIKFTYNGTDFYGFLMDGGIRPATNDAQTWKLLSAPENDLSKL